MMMSSYRYLLGVLATMVVVLLVSSCGVFSSMGGYGWGGKEPTVTHRDQHIMLIGTYTDAGSEGVYSFALDATTNLLKHTGTFITPNPSFLALDRDKKVVYIANETGEQSMATSASLDTRNGRLTSINSSYTLGEGPAYISTDGRGKVVTANYAGGSITLFDVDRDGVLGDPDWHIVLGDKGVSHPHAVLFSPNGKELFVPDKGQDKVFHFHVNDGNPPLTIDLKTTDLPTGTGPRHIIMDRKGEYAYLIAEDSPKVYVYQHRKGDLMPVQEVTLRLPSGSYGQHIALSDDGHFLYTSHTGGADVVTIFKVSHANGQLTQVGSQAVGRGPRHFALSPDGGMVAVATRVGGKVEFYHRDRATGLLSPVKDMSIELSHPAFVLWVEQY